jgi:glycerol-1-phosphate dehydrogenase [NAD(P)+]
LTTKVDCSLFGSRFDCVCGLCHEIEPAEVVFSEAAFAEAPALARRRGAGRKAAALMDVRTKAAAGDEAVAGLNEAGFEVAEILVPDGPGGSWPVCDDKTKMDLERRIGPVDWILSVGSGTINDLGKWLSADRGISYISFATAASMNGYTSANTAATVEGLKVMIHSRAAAAVVSHPRVLAEAPAEMTSAGLGDVLAKTISNTDWRLNHLLWGDYFCPQAAGLVAEIEPLYLENPEGLRARDPGAIGALFSGLLLTGAAMTMAGTSAPASGAEHLISHCLDMMSSLDGRPHDLHGRQVGVGTVLAADLYRRVLNLESPDFGRPAPTPDFSVWGPLAGIAAREFGGKAGRLEDARSRLSKGATWDNLRETLTGGLHGPDKLRDCLIRAGAAASAADIGCDRERLLEALIRAWSIRARVTVMDLAWLTGVLPGAGREITENWA